jgi:hypothetical protein
VLKTHGVRLKLELLKRNLFPKLEVNDFIAGAADFLLVEEQCAIG